MYKYATKIVSSMAGRAALSLQRYSCGWELFWKSTVEQTRVASESSEFSGIDDLDLPHQKFAV